MFWIGAAAGVTVAFLAMIVGMSAIGWSVGKERSKAAEEKDKLWQQWDEANRINQEKADIMTDILTELRCIAKK